jgi:hypothetical protein
MDRLKATISLFLIASKRPISSAAGISPLVLYLLKAVPGVVS